MVKGSPVQVLDLSGGLGKAGKLRLESEAPQVLVAATLDRWTLEILPQEVEDMYQQHYQGEWLMLQAPVQLVVAVLLCVNCRTLLRLDFKVCGMVERLGLLIGVPACVVLTALSCILMVVPQWQSWTGLIGIMLEVIGSFCVTLVHMRTPTALQDGSWYIPFGVHHSWLKGHRADEKDASALDVVVSIGCWMVWKVARKCYLLKNAWVILCLELLIWVLSLPASRSLRNSLRAFTPIVARAIMLACYYPYEYRQRCRFLQDLQLHPQQAAAPGLALRTAGASEAADSPAAAMASQPVPLPPAAAQMEPAAPAAGSDARTSLAGCSSKEATSAAQPGARMQAEGGAERTPALQLLRRGGQLCSCCAPQWVGERSRLGPECRVQPYQGPRSRMGMLHFYLQDCIPEDLDIRVGGCLALALERQGFLLNESFILPGSVKLTVLVQSRDEWFSDELDVELLLQQLSCSNVWSEHLLKDCSVQWGGTLYSMHLGKLLSKGPALPPTVQQVTPRVLATGRQAELVVIVRLEKPVVPRTLSLVLRSCSTTLLLPVPFESLQVRGRLLRITQTIEVQPRDDMACLDIRLLEVSDGEVYSAPVPLMVLSEPQLVREVAGLLQWLSTRAVPPLSCDDLLWALRDAQEFSCPKRAARSATPTARWLERQHGQDHAGMAGETGVPTTHLCLAWRVQSSVPGVLLLAVMMGMPGLARLLLQKAAPAFDCMYMRREGWADGPAEETAGEQSVVVSANKADPPPPAGPAAKALKRLLHATGSWAPSHATVLHLMVRSESGEMVKVLQTEANAQGLDLNWHARPSCSGSPEVAPGSDSAGEHVPLTAMEQAVLLLPKSGRVVRQALCGAASDAAAEAWTQALARVAPGSGLQAPRPVRYGLQTPEAAAQQAAVDMWVRQLSQVAAQRSRRHEPFTLQALLGHRQQNASWRAGGHGGGQASSFAVHSTLLSVAAIALSRPVLDGERCGGDLPAVVIGQLLLHACVHARLLYPAYATVLHALLQVHACCWPLLAQQVARELQPHVWTGVALIFIMQGAVMPLCAPLPFFWQLRTVMVTCMIRSAAGLFQQPSSEWASLGLKQAVLLVALAAALVVQRALECGPQRVRFERTRGAKKPW